MTWQAERIDRPGADVLVLRHTSPDGDEGYPGTLRAEVTYTLTDKDEVVIDYRATADRATPVNLTQHSYFNLAGHVHEPSTGRVLEVRTTEPGVQLYTGNHLDGLTGKAGERYGPRSGLAIETQHFPDSPNHPGFPSTVLRPGRTYRSRTTYEFSTRPD